MDGAGSGGPEGEDTSEERYRMVSGPLASTECQWVNHVAECWRLALEAVAPGARLSVRVVGGDVPMVRAESPALDLAALAELVCKVPEFGAGLLEPPPNVRRVRGEVMDDPSSVHPGWHAALPGVDYIDGPHDADVMAAEVEDVFDRLLPGGAVEVSPACWQDGSGWVRFDLEPESAAWVTALVWVLLGGENTQGG